MFYFFVKTLPGAEWAIRVTSLGLIIARGRCVSCHVDRASFSRPFVRDTSPKYIDLEGLGRRRTGTKQVKDHKKRYRMLPRKTRVSENFGPISKSWKCFWWVSESRICRFFFPFRLQENFFFKSRTLILKVGSRRLAKSRNYLCHCIPL